MILRKKKPLRFSILEAPMKIEKLIETLGKIVGDRENAEVKITAIKRGDIDESLSASE